MPSRARRSRVGVFMGEDLSWMERRGAAIWSAMM